MAAIASAVIDRSQARTAVRLLDRGARPARELIALATAAEDLGFDSVWTGESWSSDAFSPLAAVAGATSRVRLCTGIAQIAARTPTAMAMHAMTLDGLSEGRAAVGIGVSGPQVVEGWYGRPFAQPLARTREYVAIIREALRREGPVAAPGPHYPLPYTGEGSVGLGKPLKMITHPLRGDVPCTSAPRVRRTWPWRSRSPTAGCRSTGRRTAPTCTRSPDTIPDDFEIAVNVSVVVNDDVATALWPIKATLGFYIGGMGAKSRNFHTELMARMGFEDEAHQIQDLFFEGKRDEAIMAVPDDVRRRDLPRGSEGAHRRAAGGVARDTDHDPPRGRRRPRHHALPRRPHA